MGWLTDKLRSGRYSMNLQLLQADLASSSKQHRASVVVAAAAMLAKLQVDDFITGTQLERAAFGVIGTSSEEASGFYNALEDVLSMAEAQRKQVVKQATDRLGAEGAKEMNRHAQIQQQGIRLILVALARKVDDSFKAKARILRESMYESKELISTEVSSLKQQDELTASLSLNIQQRDYESIEVKAELIALSFVGW
jgi:hypothetical protein